jgi:hypothetical protein
MYLEFERSINRADNIINAFFITAGDFNLPGWDWKTKSLKANTNVPSMSTYTTNSHTS